MKNVMGLILCGFLGISGAMAADDGTVDGGALKAVHAYMKEVELMRIVGSYSGGDNGVFVESQKRMFKEAVAAAGGKQQLVDALKAIRGAEIAFLDHASAITRANLDKAVGAVKVELELVE